MCQGGELTNPILLTALWGQVGEILFAAAVFFPTLVAPIWWFIKTKRSSATRKRQWWAVALGTMLLLPMAERSRTPQFSDASKAEQLGTALADLAFCGGAVWLLAWGLRGEKLNNCPSSVSCQQLRVFCTYITHKASPMKPGLLFCG
jgi:hypothetical protein